MEQLSWTWHALRNFYAISQGAAIGWGCTTRHWLITLATPLEHRPLKEDTEIAETQHTYEHSQKHQYLFQKAIIASAQQQQ